MVEKLRGVKLAKNAGNWRMKSAKTKSKSKSKSKAPATVAEAPAAEA